MKKALLYFRTSGQIGKSNAGLGYEVQKDECRKYCKKNKIEIIGEYFDDGISGDDEHLEKSTALLEMMAALNGNDLVIAKDTSRLMGRGKYRQAWLTKELRKSEKQVYFIDNPDYDLYSDDPADILLNTIIEAIDVFQKMEISLKLYRARRMNVIKRKQKAAGRLPWGYYWKNGRVKEDLECRPIVEDVFRRAAGGHSCKSISEWLKAEQEIKISPKTINNMLRNDFYIGKIKYGTAEAENSDFALINKVTFGKVQKALDRRNTRK